MIHINLDEGDIRTSGTGSTLMEEYKAITARLMHHMKESGMDKAWIYDAMHKSLMLSLASAFPEEPEESEEISNMKKIILSDFFKKN